MIQVLNDHGDQSNVLMFFMSGLENVIRAINIL